MKKVTIILATAGLFFACNNRTHGNGYIHKVEEGHGEHVDHESHGHDESHATKHEEVAAEKSYTENSHLDANGNYIIEIGELFDIKLADGSVLNVGKLSTENKLFSMLNNANFSVNEDKTQGWVTLDRTYFETGTSGLIATSKEQLNRIATILKAYPTAEVKIGGYTDNTGGEDVNKKVSKDRATTVMSTLVGLGVDAARLNAEGYGPQHSLCSANETDECKAQNRRVDVRITKK